MALKIPERGGKPVAIAIPRHSGNAIRKIRKPDNKSGFQFCFNASIPSVGILNLFIFIQYLTITY
jgi:hypothetical protein